jgi:hypothetical protein
LRLTPDRTSTTYWNEANPSSLICASLAEHDIANGRARIHRRILTAGMLPTLEIPRNRLQGRISPLTNDRPKPPRWSMTQRDCLIAPDIALRRSGCASTTGFSGLTSTTELYLRGTRFLGRSQRLEEDPTVSLFAASEPPPRWNFIFIVGLLYY